MSDTVVFVLAMVAIAGLVLFLYRRRLTGIDVDVRRGRVKASMQAEESSGAGRGASITKSTSTHGGATAMDKTGHSASISETKTKGELTAEVSDARSDVKKKD
jgi:hypothetical protein